MTNVPSDVRGRDEKYRESLRDVLKEEKDIIIIVQCGTAGGGTGRLIIQINELQSDALLGLVYFNREGTKA